MASIRLPQYATASERVTRGLNLAEQRDRYAWVHAPGLPPWCRGIPEGEAFSRSKGLRFRTKLGTTAASLLLTVEARLLTRPATLADYDRYYTLLTKPDVMTRWRDDDEFARQRVNGIYPNLIRRIQEIPDNFPVTEAVVAPVLRDRGLTLEALLKEGRLYLSDYAILEGIPCTPGRFQVAPMALLYVDQHRQLLPLAIQLGQSPATAPVIFTPKDPTWLWRLAKAFVQCADGTVHEVAAHLVRTHLAMEPVWVAANRTLPPQHPIHVLLRPHFTDTLQINQDARDVMLAPGGPIDEAIAVGAEGSFVLAARAWERWDFDACDPQACFDRRDVNDLPGYYYREDALALWAAIGTYACELVTGIYREDRQVRADTELQAFVRELQSSSGGQLRGVPGAGAGMQTMDQLIRLLRLVLWTVSAEHSAVNNGQYDQLGYVPNTPGAMYVPPPTTKDAVSEATFAYALPLPDAVAQQITMVNLLSLPTLLPLGRYGQTFFQGVPEVQLAVDRFRARMSDIGRRIDARNKRLRVPYSYLHPARVGRSIDI